MYAQARRAANAAYKKRRRAGVHNIIMADREVYIQTLLDRLRRAHRSELRAKVMWLRARDNMSRIEAECQQQNTHPINLSQYRIFVHERGSAEDALPQLRQNFQQLEDEFRVAVQGLTRRLTAEERGWLNSDAC